MNPHKLEFHFTVSLLWLKDQPGSWINNIGIPAEMAGATIFRAWLHQFKVALTWSWHAHSAVPLMTFIVAPWDQKNHCRKSANFRHQKFEDRNA